MQTISSISTRKTRRFIRSAKPMQEVCITPFSLKARLCSKQSKAKALARVFGVLVSFIKG